ncbi:tripartite tricarboxylate transporter TctB family protein [Rhodobacteraceae bacterium]|nr:tripartite tricarboxylate transporter TctB family protein [Paracoccaceae bacterium]
MTSFTDRQAGYVLLTASGLLALYVVFSDWAFVEMRDGTLIGSFPMAFVALCLLFAARIAFAREAREQKLEDVAELTATGIAKITAFLVGALLLAFYHETLGFVGLCILFLVMNALFMGQRKPVGLLIYSACVCAALYLLFTLLGFELTVLPTVLGV